MRPGSRRRGALRVATGAGLLAFALGGTSGASQPAAAPPAAARGIPTMSEGASPLQVAVSMAAASREIEVDPNLTPEVEGCVRAQSVVEVAASPQTVREAILDLQARVDESWLVDSVEVYLDEQSEEGVHRRAKWTLSVLGVDIVYHTVYRWNRKTSEIVWDLDHDRPNDLRRAQGRYRLSPGSAPGTTTITYVFEIGTRHRVTDGLKRRLTVRSVRELLESIRSRSEASA